MDKTTEHNIDAIIQKHLHSMERKRKKKKQVIHGGHDVHHHVISRNRET